MTYFQYVCLECGWIYDETAGMPERGIAPGTRWEDLPDDFQCDDCDIRKSDTHMWQRLAV
jgi:rubredoxin